ncbi:MAG: methionine adenosyltransferase [Bdellovibrionota bacterium]|nr:methionine adenosyltransferase [Bdellovibrionota bacterium]
MSNDFIFSSESVSEGHPDKVCDKISDSILDEALTQDPHSRVAIETLVKNNEVVVAGELTTKATIDYDKVVRNAIKEIGYDKEDLGFYYKTCNITKFIFEQSPDISQGVTEGQGLFKEMGAGDQGLMFGYASNEAMNYDAEYMPLGIFLAHKLINRHKEIRKSDKNTFLRPDAKAQVSIKYINGKPYKIDTVVLSSQHTEDVSYDDLKDYMIEEIVQKTIDKNLIDKDTKFLINPTGRFVIGGPVGDSGLTGRKIIVDTYGGYAHHGGGAFSGKDPSKVDRSAAYMARHIAKSIVASNLADKCEIQIAYAIGVAEPVSVMVDTFNTEKISKNEIVKKVKDNFDLTPLGIIRHLDLLRPIYTVTTSGGHFGRKAENGYFTWEKVKKL